jgi:hypothetical protein
MAVVYRFRTWDITNDCYRDSARWATREAVERVSGEATSEGVEVDDKFLGREVVGMTERHFDPRHPPSADFPDFVHG